MSTTFVNCADFPQKNIQRKTFGVQIPKIFLGGSYKENPDEMMQNMMGIQDFL